MEPTHSEFRQLLRSVVKLKFISINSVSNVPNNCLWVFMVADTWISTDHRFLVQFCIRKKSLSALLSDHHHATVYSNLSLLKPNLSLPIHCRPYITALDHLVTSRFSVDSCILRTWGLAAIQPPLSMEYASVALVHTQPSDCKEQARDDVLWLLASQDRVSRQNKQLTVHLQACSVYALWF